MLSWFSQLCSWLVAGGCMYSDELRPGPSHGGALHWLSCLRRNIIIMKLSSTTTLIIPTMIFKIPTQRMVKNLSKLRKNLEFLKQYLHDIIYLPYLLNRSWWTRRLARSSLRTYCWCSPWSTRRSPSQPRVRPGGNDASIPPSLQLRQLGHFSCCSIYLL